MRLTKKEKTILIKEIAQRCKDMVYMTAGKHAKVIVATINSKGFDGRKTEDIIDITYTFHMCMGDILQIVGRHRRKRRSPLDK